MKACSESHAEYLALGAAALHLRLRGYRWERIAAALEISPWLARRATCTYLVALAVQHPRDAPTQVTLAGLQADTRDDTRKMLVTERPKTTVSP